MKKIMFKDKYGLTQAVLAGRKTRTRRLATEEDVKEPKFCWGLEGEDKGHPDNGVLFFIDNLQPNRRPKPTHRTTADAIFAKRQKQ